MKKSNWIQAVLVMTGLGFPASAHSQIATEGKLYAITAGTYVEVGGIWGVLTVRLPNPRQTFIELTIPPAGGPASLTFWSKDWRTPSRILTNGLVAGNTIQFHYFTGHPYGIPVVAMVDYTVTIDPGRLSLDGAITSEPICCDIPNYFGHTNVIAIPIPVLGATRPSTSQGGVEIRWNSESNLLYQVQWRSVLGTNDWTNLGPPQSGTNGTCCLSDMVTPAEPQRFYRLEVRPNTPP